MLERTSRRIWISGELVVRDAQFSVSTLTSRLTYFKRSIAKPGKWV
jgi:hypothetical protein